jgi:ABC-2 type transport system permease protein
MYIIRLYFKYAGASIRSQMQYRTSFIMLSIGHFVGTVTEIFAIWLLFQRFGNLKNWRLAEVAVFYGIIHISFALAESIGRGFDYFGRFIKTGDFDRLLLRPLGTAFQVAGQEIQLYRIGRLAQAMLVFFLGVNQLNLSWSLARIGLTIFTISSAFSLFYGLFVLQATLAFWSTETLEIMNTMTYGGTETAQYPLSIYPKWFRRFFTFIVPLGSVSYFPTLAIIQKPDPLGSPVWFQWTSPFIGFIFLILCFQFWKYGVRQYRSTGS